MGRLSEGRSVQIVRLLKQAGLEWYKSRTFELGAALAFYAIFSIAPVIVLAFTAASLVLGKEAAQGRVTQEIESTVGHTVAVAIQATAQYTYRSGSGVPATVLSIVFFGFGATGLFLQLQSALNAIWEVKPKPGRRLRGFLHDRFGSFLAILGISSLLLAELLVTAALAALGRILPSSLTLQGFPLWRAVTLRRVLGIPHAGHRAGLPHFARRQDRLARRLGRGGRQRPAVPARQSLDRLVSGGNQHHFGLWGSRFDRDCPAVGLLFFAGRAVRRGVHTSLRQIPRLAPGTERKRGARQPKGACLTDSANQRAISNFPLPSALRTV